MTAQIIQFPTPAAAAACRAAIGRAPVTPIERYLSQRIADVERANALARSGELDPYPDTPELQALFLKGMEKVRRLLRLRKNDSGL